MQASPAPLNATSGTPKGTRFVHELLRVSHRYPPLQRRFSNRERRGLDCHGGSNAPWVGSMNGDGCTIRADHSPRPGTVHQVHQSGAARTSPRAPEPAGPAREPSGSSRLRHLQCCVGRRPIATTLRTYPSRIDSGKCGATSAFSECNVVPRSSRTVLGVGPNPGDLDEFMTA